MTLSAAVRQYCLAGVWILLCAVTPAAETTGKVKFKNADGSTAYEIKCKPDGAKLVDSAGKELARIHRDGGKIRIKGADDATLGFVTGSSPNWKIKDAAQKTVLFEYQLQSDGDYRLEDGKEKTLVKVKARDDGFELKLPDGKTVSQIDARAGKVSIRDAADRPLLSTGDSSSSAAVAALALEPLFPHQRAGLWYALEGGCGGQGINSGQGSRR